LPACSLARGASPARRLAIVDPVAAGAGICCWPSRCPLRLPCCSSERGSGTLQTSLLLNSLISFLGSFSSVWIARRVLDRRSFASLGLVPNSSAAKDLAIGIGIAAVMMGAILALELIAAGPASKAGRGRRSRLTGGHRPAGCPGCLHRRRFQEEILSRGSTCKYPEGTSLFWGSCCPPRSSPCCTSATRIRSGTRPSSACLRRPVPGLRLAAQRALWLRSGCTSAGTCSRTRLRVPGQRPRHRASARPHRHRPTLLTGGAFGPEAGLIILPAWPWGRVGLGLHPQARERPALPACANRSRLATPRPL